MKIEFKIEGMNCPHCVKAIEKNLSKLNLKKADVKIGSAEIEFDESIISEKVIASAINEAGYSVIKYYKQA